MAIKYRHLSRSSSHRQSLLRNLVTALIEHEAISTTYAKAKEAQRLAEKLITLGKRNTGAARNQAQQIFFEPHKHIEKLFGPLRTRYASRPGGYTRVLRQEPTKDDNAPSAILCLVDGPRDVRFDMTVRALAREQELEMPMRELTAVNVRKVTRFREDGIDVLEKAVKRFSLKGEIGPDADVDVDADLAQEVKAVRENEYNSNSNNNKSKSREQGRNPEAEEKDIEEDAEAEWEDISPPMAPGHSGGKIDRHALRHAAATPRSGLRVGGSRKARRAATKRRVQQRAA